MNKKTYFKPAVELINAETEQMMALSIPLYYQDGDVAVDDGLAPTFDIFAEE